MTIELSDCPKCGSHNVSCNEVCFRYDKKTGTAEVYYMVQCDDCDCSDPMYRKESDAINAWNGTEV